MHTCPSAFCQSRHDVVALITRRPIQVLLEGRTITVEYEGFYIVATYVPNSGDKLQRLDFRTQV